MDSEISNQFDLRKYNNVIFDCDGVILDSNKIKENNIHSVSSLYINENILKEFLEFFNSNAGIPREIKIKIYIQDKTIIKRILKEYNILNLKSLKEANIVEGFEKFILSLENFRGNKYVVSGSDQNELLEVLRHKNIDKYFKKILGGPNTKHKNIRKLKINSKTLYFGDSKIDYEVCVYNGFDFVFVKGYTNRDIEFDKKSQIDIYEIVNFNNIKY